MGDDDDLFREYDRGGKGTRGYECYYFSITIRIEKGRRIGSGAT